MMHLVNSENDIAERGRRVGGHAGVRFDHLKCWFTLSVEFRIQSYPHRSIRVYETPSIFLDPCLKEWQVTFRVVRRERRSARLNGRLIGSTWNFEHFDSSNVLFIVIRSYHVADIEPQSDLDSNLPS
jgi:hypothetical protein